MSKTDIGRDAIDHANRIASMPVSGGTPIRRLAGAVWKYTQEGYRVDLRAIGAGAISQAVKSIIIARMMASAQGKDLYVVPTFENTPVNELGPDGRYVVRSKSMVRMYVVTQSLSVTLPKPDISYIPLPTPEAIREET